MQVLGVAVGLRDRKAGVTVMVMLMLMLMVMVMVMVMVMMTTMLTLLSACWF